MMAYDNYHFTTKVTTMHNADYELVGDNRNILLGGGCMVHFPTGHKFAGQWIPYYHREVLVGAAAAGSGRHPHLCRALV